MIIGSHELTGHGLWRRWAARALLACGFATLLSGPAWAQASSPLNVVASLQPYGDLVGRVAGDRAAVSVLLPPGASPHAFDPSPSQATALANADLVVMNGGLDAWLLRLVDATSPDAAQLVVMDAISFEPIEGHERSDAADHDSHAGHELANPHVWLDPRLAARAVDAVAAALTELDPAGADTYQANAERTRAALAAVDAEVAELLAPVAGAPFVPFHDAWVYFVTRYGLDVVVTLEPFPGREPSPRYLAEAVRAVRQAGARAIFAERQLGTRSAEVVAESAGVALAVLDPIGGAPGPETYEELLLSNARVILAALGD